MGVTVNAQTSATATITGNIADANSAALAGAEVELSDLSTNQSQKLIANGEGHYSFPRVLPGVYKITVTAKGFRQAVMPSLKVEVAKSYTVNLTLEIGSVGEVVEVTAGAVVELQRNDSTVGAVIGGERLLRLPSINRSAAALLTVQPMVQPSRGSRDHNFGGQVAGARSDQSTFNLDGADATDLVAGTGNYVSGVVDFQGPTPMIPVPAESIEEFRVGTTNPNATFGRSAGGQVSFITKRGGNALHGSAYLYHQNDNLNANRWESNRLGIKKPELKDNRFGATLGGPIWKDKTFFFGHYEGRRLPQSAIINRIVPTSTLKQGILRFRDAAGNVANYDIKGFDPRGVGISPVIRDFWNKMPDGNDPSRGDGLNTVGFVGPALATIGMDFGVVRLDHVFNEKWSFNGTYRQASQKALDSGQVDIAGIVSGNTRGVASPLASTPVKPRFLSAQLTGQLSPTLINEFNFGYARNWWAYVRQAPIPQVSGTTGALMIALNAAATPGLDQGIDVDTQRARSRVWNDYIWQFGDNLTWVKSSHTFQFGGMWRRMPVFHERDDKVIGSLSSLVYELNARTSVSIPAGSRPQPCGGGVTANCLQSGDASRWNDLFAGALGMVDKAGILRAFDGGLNLLPEGAPLQIDGQFKGAEFYANDVWRLTPGLTLTAGLTYSLQMAPVDKNGKQTFIIDPGSKEIITSKDYLERRRQAALQGNVFNPTLGWLPIRESGRDRIYPTDTNNFGPRISAAWTPNFGEGFLKRITGDQKTVLRGGYSMTYDRANAVAIIMVPILGIGFSQTQECRGPRVNPQAASPTTKFLGCIGADPSNAFRIGVDGSTVPLPPDISKLQSPVIPGTNTATETLQFSIDPNLTIGYSHNVDFTIQRELWKDYLLEVGYAGRLSRNLQQNVQLSTVPLFMKDSASGQTFAQAYDAVATAIRAKATVASQSWFENQLNGATFRINNQDVKCGTVPGATTTCTAALVALQSTNFEQGAVNSIFTLINGARPAGPIINRSVLDLFVRTNGGLSNYHSGFVSLTKRMSRGLTYTINYTLSRALDQFGLNQENIGVSSFSYDLNADYGPAVFDRTHVFNASWYYELPFRGGALNKLIGGWYTSGIYTANSGVPLTVGQHPQAFGGDPLNFSITAGAIPKGKLNLGNSVNRTPGVGAVGTNAGGKGSGLNIFADPEAAFNSFRHILISQDTRHGRGVLRGFPRWNVDLSIGKKTNITEQVKTVFTFDLINAFNRMEFDDQAPAFSLDLRNRAAFGVLTQQFANPRQIQLGLRFEF
ncbi:MAG: carboxypeptidase regulatory-like domain-containing protein [Blastocatellia bacterium]